MCRWWVRSTVEKESSRPRFRWRRPMAFSVRPPVNTTIVTIGHYITTHSSSISVYTLTSVYLYLFYTFSGGRRGRATAQNPHPKNIGDVSTKSVICFLGKVVYDMRFLTGLFGQQTQFKCLCACALWMEFGVCWRFFVVEGLLWSLSGRPRIFDWDAWRLRCWVMFWWIICLHVA